MLQRHKNKYSLIYLRQRITGLILIPLSIWFIYHLLSFTKSFDPYYFHRLMENKPNGMSAVIFTLVALYHGYLGVACIITDYVHNNRIRVSLKLFVALISLLSALPPIYFFIKLTLGAQI